VKTGKEVSRRRIPKASPLKKLQGTWRKDRDLETVEMSATLPDPPVWLPPEATEGWNRTRSLLLEYNLISELDIPTFSAYCIYFSDIQRLTREIEKTGAKFKT